MQDSMIMFTQIPQTIDALDWLVYVLAGTMPVISTLAIYIVKEKNIRIKERDKDMELLHSEIKIMHAARERERYESKQDFKDITLLSSEMLRTIDKLLSDDKNDK